jgi:hypothetical protein
MSGSELFKKSEYFFQILKKFQNKLWKYFFRRNMDVLNDVFFQCTKNQYEISYILGTAKITKLQIF